MPKRAPTPPPADDTRFFTVVNPYPEQPYIALQDSKTFARWVACVIGQENLLAFYHKPKSPNVVIIETPSSGPDFVRLMGKHCWGEFLRRPVVAEKGEVSYILPCTMTTPRAMEKNGWICRDIPSAWFNKWSPEADSLIAHPYPQPRHCEPPSEDVTRYPLCRPIPPPPEANPEAGRIPAARPFKPTRNASSSSSASDEDLPTSSPSSDFSHIPTTPPGLTERFIPAIHGCDIPKAGVVFINRARVPVSLLRAADADDDDGRAEEAEKGLCSAHGSLCVSGICKECAARKREAKFAERMQQREADRGRGRGQGRPPHDRERRKATGGPAEAPPHLQRGTPLDEKRGARVREDIRVEMAGRAATSKHDAKSVASSTGTRALPPHLCKGTSSRSSKPARSLLSASASSSSAASLASVSASAHSDNALSDTSISPPSSICDPAEEPSPMPFRPSAIFQSPAIPQPKLQTRVPQAPRGSWRVPSSISSDNSSKTNNTSPNAWKQARAACPPPRQRALEAAERLPSAGVRSAWDDDSDSSEDEEGF